MWFTTKKEGRAMVQNVRKVEDRTAKIESELEDGRKRLTDMVDRARTDVEKLEETLTRATRVLARNSADFGADMETIKNKLREIDGSLAELHHDVEQSQERLETASKKVEEFARAAGVDLPVDASKVPAKSSDHFRMIEQSFAEMRYGETRSLAKLFLSRHSKDRRADEAQMFVAKSYLQQKRWAKALGSLRRFTDNYPKSDLTPEVLYEMARAFFSLGDCTDARILTEAVSTRHKRSPYAQKAVKLNEQMKKDKGRCTS